MNSTEDSGPLLLSACPEQGLDLSDRQVIRLVRRIWFARFAARAERSGIDPEEGLSEVLLALVRKQQSERSRYDPTRSGRTKYIFLVCGSILSHMVEARRCRPDLVLDEALPEDEDGRGPSHLDLAPAPAEVGELAYLDLQDQVLEQGGARIPLPVLARVAGGQEARGAGLAEGLGWMEAEALASAWRAFAARRTAASTEAPEDSSVMALFG